MSGSGFGPGDVVNRRVNSHLQELLPTQVSAQKDYHLEGQRVLPAEEIPGPADRCLCLLESYVGVDGQFEVQVERIFDRGSESEWRIENTISRTGSGSLSPFSYLVQTTIELMDDVRTDRSQVTWEELGEEPIHGGTEAQAAVLLTEKMSHLRARERGHGMDHAGSLSSLGSLSNVIDDALQLDTDWGELDTLLGPDSDTIAATVGFDALEAQAERLEAEKKGIDFLGDNPFDGMEDFGSDDAGTTEQGGGGKTDRARPSWMTPPAELTVEETEAELQNLSEEIREMKQRFADDSSSE